MRIHACRSCDGPKEKGKEGQSKIERTADKGNEGVGKKTGYTTDAQL